MTLSRLLIASLAFVCLGQSTLAGAWPRDVKTAFLSMQLRQNPDNLDGDPMAAVYLEYGLRRALTIGAKIEYDFALDDVENVELFGRWHLPENSFPLRTALGIALNGDRDVRRLAPSVHLGRGFETKLGSGWADIELNIETPIDDWAPSYQAYAQMGLKPHDQFMAMVSLDALRSGGETQIKAIPSVAWEFMEGRHLNVEYSRVLEGDGADEVSLGLWLEF